MLTTSLFCLVVAVTDGDTIKARCQDGLVTLRMVGIDAPEKKQDWGKDAHESLARLCLDKPAYLYTRGKDRYGRTLGHLTCNGVDAQAHQMRQGMAWVYKPGPVDMGLLMLEAEARHKKIGLWSDKNPAAPWEWRKAQKGSPAKVAQKPSKKVAKKTSKPVTVSKENKKQRKLTKNRIGSRQYSRSEPPPEILLQ